MAESETKEFRSFVIEYDDPYGEGRWGCDLAADDYMDAQRRLQSIRNTGVIMPGSFPMNDRWAHTTKTYVFQCTETKRLKIGRTRQPVKSRLMQMQLPAPAEILTEIECDIERELHEIYKDYRVNGEWFNPVILETLHTEIDRLLDIEAKRLYGG